MSIEFSDKKHQIGVYFELVACKCSHRTAVKYWIVPRPPCQPLNARSIKGRIVDVAENMRRISWGATNLWPISDILAFQTDKQAGQTDCCKTLKRRCWAKLGILVPYGQGRMTYNLFSNNRVVDYFKWQKVRAAPKRMQHNVKWQRSFNKRTS